MYTLYESGTSRSARCRWTLLGPGIPFKPIAKKDLKGRDALLALHPLGKTPVVLIEGKPLFESAAICSYLADRAPDVNLIATPGS